MTNPDMVPLNTSNDAQNIWLKLINLELITQKCGPCASLNQKQVVLFISQLPSLLLRCKE